MPTGPTVPTGPTHRPQFDWLRDQAGRAGGIQGAWVLALCDDQQAPPRVDGKPVPVITRAQWARTPEPWLQHVHRGVTSSES